MSSPTATTCGGRSGWPWTEHGRSSRKTAAVQHGEEGGEVVQWHRGSGEGAPSGGGVVEAEPQFQIRDGGDEAADGCRGEVRQRLRRGRAPWARAGVQIERGRGVVRERWDRGGGVMGVGYGGWDMRDGIMKVGYWGWDHGMG